MRVIAQAALKDSNAGLASSFTVSVATAAERRQAMRRRQKLSPRLFFIVSAAPKAQICALGRWVGLAYLRRL